MNNITIIQKNISTKLKQNDFQDYEYIYFLICLFGAIIFTMIIKFDKPYFLYEP